MPRVRGGRGYLMVDNRASGGELKEYATLTCAHGGHIVVMNPDRKRTRNYCAKCHAYYCDDCVGCVPIEKAIELAQKYPGLPVLPRGKHGELLFNPTLLDEGKVYPVS